MVLPRHILQRERHPWLDEYTMHANVDPGGSDEYAPVAMMRVMKYPNPVMHTPGGLLPGAHPAVTAYHYDQENPASGETLPMFKGPHDGAHHEVSELYTTKRHRTVAPTMVGVAEVTARRETGRDVQGSSDLSPYSHQFMQHLAARGALSKDDVPAAPSNDLDFRVMDQRSAQWKSPEDLGAHIANTGSVDLTDSGEHQEGRAAIRSVLRAGRPSRAQHFEQGALF